MNFEISFKLVSKSISIFFYVNFNFSIVDVIKLCYNVVRNNSSKNHIDTIILHFLKNLNDSRL